VQRGSDVRPALARTLNLAREGLAVWVNVWLGKTQFRERSLSM